MKFNPVLASGKRLSLTVLSILALGGCAGYGSSAVLAEGRSPDSSCNVTDMEQRTVVVPCTIDRVVTLGSQPPLNSFVFAVGAGDRLVNGLHERWGDRWDYQRNVFAPHLADQPVTQSADNMPRAERILQLDPDVVLTMSPELVEPMEEIGVPVIVLQWREPTDVKRVVNLLGELLDEEDRARAYTAYFDGALAEVAEVTADTAVEDRPSVLYLDAKAMTRPHLIAEWWISEAGGRSVTERSTEEVVPLGIEQIVNWNPDFIFVTNPDQIAAVLNDSRLATVDAVKNRSVYALPIGAHNWGNRTSEQPLTVFWAANKLHPDLIGRDVLMKEVSSFYSLLFGIDLSEAQVSGVLADV